MRNLIFMSLNFLILLLVATHIGVKPGSFLQPWAMCLVFLPQLCFILLSQQLKAIPGFFQRFIHNKATAPDESLFERMITLGMFQGFVGGVIGTIHLMANLTDPAKMGKGFAIMLLSLFYGLYPSTLFIFRIRKSLRANAAAFLVLGTLLVAISIHFVLKGLTHLPNTETTTTPALLRHYEPLKFYDDFSPRQREAVPLIPLISSKIKG